MNEPTVLMWYDNSVLMTFLGVIVGGIIGFVGSIIQSGITAKNNIDVVKAQSEKEIEQHRYMEKEKLYSDLIGFVPEFTLAFNPSARKLQLSREQTVRLNSFKARLSIFASKEIYEEFYDLIIYITEESDSKKITVRMDAFTEMLLADLMNMQNQSNSNSKLKKVRSQKPSLSQ